MYKLLSVRPNAIRFSVRVLKLMHDMVIEFGDVIIFSIVSFSFETMYMDIVEANANTLFEVLMIFLFQYCTPDGMMPYMRFVQLSASMGNPLIAIYVNPPNVTNYTILDVYLH